MLHTLRLTLVFRLRYALLCHIVSCCVYYTGETSLEVNTEADSNDITEHPQDDKPRPYVCTVCDKRYTTKQYLNHHKISHTAVKLYSCTQCGKRFAHQKNLSKHMNIHGSSALNVESVIEPVIT